MEVGAAFLLILLVIVIAGAGLAVYAIAARLRRRQLDPREDRVETPRAGTEEQGRPEHIRVGNEQRTRFVPHR